MKAMNAAFALGMVVAALAACETGPKVGIVTATPADRTLQVGDMMPSFKFVSTGGKIIDSERIMGDVTVIAVIESENPKICLIVGNILELAKKYSDFYADVKYINVTAPPRDKCDLRANVVEACQLQSRRIVGLCDKAGKLRRLLGMKKSNLYVVVGHDGRIVARGDIADTASMSKAVKKAVDNYEKVRKPRYQDVY